MPTMRDPSIAFDADLLLRFERRGPRYTSYPTADRFGAAFGPAAYRRAVANRNVAGRERLLSLYVHLPFCRSLCFYCGCNKIITRDAGKAGRYLEYLAREIELQAALFAGDRRVTSMHWGGGTPTFYDLEKLQALWRKLAQEWDLSPAGDYAIEIDPRTADEDTIAGLGEMGFNRVSFGVQDFEHEVQVAVNRVQSAERTLSVIRAARRAAFRSINVDLIYGLPKQSLETLERTLARVIAAQPDRIALYNYAHLPALFKPQRQIREEDLPSAASRLELFAFALSRLGEAGYVHIGLDHFARPQDELAVAGRQGLLRRDFQGYSTGPQCDLTGLGVSAIGAIGATYSQNHRELKDYYARLDCGEVPIMRGIKLSADDLVRRAVIQELMCRFAVSREAIEISYLIAFDRYFAPELEALRPFEEAGLVAREGDWLVVTPRGRLLVRSICMVFDRYLQGADHGSRHSRVI